MRFTTAIGVIILLTWFAFPSIRKQLAWVGVMFGGAVFALELLA